MRTTKWALPVTLVVGLALAGAGAGAFASRRVAEEPPKKNDPPAAKNAAGPPAAAGSAKEDALKKALVEAARRTFEINWARMQGGRSGTVDEIYLWSRRWLEAELEMGGAKERKEAALKRHLDRMTVLAKFAHMMATTGQGRSSDASGADFFRIQAELWLAREQGAKKPR